MTCPATTWDEVLAELEHLRPRTNVELCRCRLPHPRDAGLRKALGKPRRGAVAQWRQVLPDGRGLHVIEYSDRYEAHLDEHDPRAALGQHLRRDAPDVLVRGAQLFGALLAGVGAAAIAGPAVALAAAPVASVVAGAAAARWVLSGSDTRADGEED